KIGHCDLQHGNVLVASGDVKLIDYDGMYVPALRGRGSHEKGHPAYQHPEREGTDFDERVDRFPALVIHTSLIALAEAPELWKRYYDEDNLIFRRSDFQNPDASAVFQDLEQMGGAVAEQTAALKQACKRPIQDSPRLRDTHGGKSPKPAPSSAKILPLPMDNRSETQPSANSAATTAP